MQPLPPKKARCPHCGETVLRESSFSILAATVGVLAILILSVFLYYAHSRVESAGPSVTGSTRPALGY